MFHRTALSVGHLLLSPFLNSLVYPTILTIEWENEDH